MNSLCCKRLRIQAKSEPPNTPTRETSSASFSLGSKAIYCTHLCIRNTWEEQTLTRVVGAWVAVVKLPRTITVPLHVAPLRGWKLGACHAGTCSSDRICRQHASSFQFRGACSPVVRIAQTSQAQYYSDCFRHSATMLQRRIDDQPAISRKMIGDL